jgi:hypothetical protein
MALRAEKQAVRLAADLTPGVRAVSDNLIVESSASRYRMTLRSHQPILAAWFLF